MTLQELKLSIVDPETYGPVKGFIILKCLENHFIVDQYLDALEKDSQYELNKVSSIFEPTTSALSLVFDYDNRINIIKTDEFNEFADNYDDLGTIIVVCNTIDKKVDPFVKPYVIEIPKLQEWQIHDYIMVNSALGSDMANYLIKAAKGDIYKVTAELDKIQLFPKEQQQLLFADLINDPNTDLYDQSLLDVSSAMLKGDRIAVLNALLHRYILDMDPMWLISLLITNFKKILFINFNSGLSAEDLKVTPKQINAIKYYYKHFTLDQVKAAIDFLTSIDAKLKNGELILDQSHLFDYIMNKIIV